MHGKASLVRLARLFLQPTKNKICVKKSCTKRAEKMSTFHENRKSTRQARHLLGFMRCCWQRTSLILVSPYSILVRIFNWKLCWIHTDSRLCTSNFNQSCAWKQLSFKMPTFYYSLLHIKSLAWHIKKKITEISFSQQRCVCLYV